MKPVFVEIIKNQYCANWLDAKLLTFSDSRRTSIHNSLNNVFSFLEKANIDHSMNDSSKRDYSLIFETFARWTEILHQESPSFKHLEIIKTLELISNEWLGEEADNYLISLSEGEYAFRQPICQLSVLNDITDHGWGAHFDHMYLEINAPRYFFEDMFTNSVLFHEIGHFVDFIKHISDDVFDGLESQLLDNNNNKDILMQSFPYLITTGYDKSRDEVKLRSHIKEYFADVFGAQYVGKHIMNHALRREDNRLDTEDSEHPSCNQRVLMVDKFIEYCKTGNTDNILLKKIIEIAEDANKDPMNIRYTDIDSSCFLSGTAFAITQKSELYGIYSKIWELYELGQAYFKTANPTFPWCDNMFGIYTKLNQLAKDSISRYI